MSEYIKTRPGAMAKPETVRASAGTAVSFRLNPTTQGAAPVSAINETPPPAVGASPFDLAAWAVDTGRFSGADEIGVVTVIARGYASRDEVIAHEPARYDNRAFTAARQQDQQLVSARAKFEARAVRTAAKVPATKPAPVRGPDPIDAALEAAFPAFPDEVAKANAVQAVRASAAPARGGALPGAREALGQLYYATTGKQWTVQASAAQDKAPEPFPGSGDLPLATASGLDPALLARVPWQARWAITKAPTIAEASQLLNASAAMAADFGNLSTSWPPTGLDADAAAYVNEYRRHLSGFPSS